MPRRTIDFTKGSYYHIYNRGAGGQSIFRTPHDYHELLYRLKNVANDCNVSIICYALLPNHYHWLARQDGDTQVSKVPARVFGSYSQSFNLRNKRTGTLFEGPFQAILVETDEYKRQLCRYIHANPVLHGIANSPELWPYSNYHEWVGQRQGSLIDHDFVSDYFDEPNAYKRYLQAYLQGRASMPDGLQKYLDCL